MRDAWGMTAWSPHSQSILHLARVAVSVLVHPKQKTSPNRHGWIILQSAALALVPLPLARLHGVIQVATITSAALAMQLVHTVRMRVIPHLW